MTNEKIIILTLEAKVRRLQQEIRVYEAHINVTCERCGREAGKDFNGNEYHLHNNNRYCDEVDVEKYRVRK